MKANTNTESPTPGRPETYHTAPNDHRGRGASSEIVLVPINDPKRSRVLFAKVERTAFDSLPDRVRNASWAVVLDGAATNDRQVTVRAMVAGSLVTISRIIMNAKPGEYVRNLNGNRLDLRTTNLRLKEGKAGKRYSKRHDLALVRQAAV
ncbi:hypothetical protein [Mesorhizobium sp.]|uniref:hypothetical protein n=1 Tax=Mesorhizobium sp. TaxID=1871066 RepID=UPI0012200023|nr:hypothetical protein [Mesorhizobium sp.]TIP72178.1 MAG: hypothetical protein E5X55_19405 [Mesorhizobium sp.]TJV96451.1 MAG: hypothetical protein E5X52_18680 [Mesorhizobium sp.]